MLLKLLGRKPTRVNTADLNPLNPNFCASRCFEYSVPTHCIAFTSPKTKTNRKTREPSAHSKPLTKDFSIPFACHAKENLVPLLGLSDSRAYVLALHILWSMMWAPKSNQPKSLR